MFFLVKFFSDDEQLLVLMDNIVDKILNGRWKPYFYLLTPLICGQLPKAVLSDLLILVQPVLHLAKLLPQ